MQAISAANKVVFYTQAYNAEKTLHRTIDSILRQTYANFVYFVCDDGSTDGTREIILNYAKKDDRVIPILHDVNHKLEVEPTDSIFTFIDSCIRNNDDDVYFSNLDADDE